MPKVLSKPSCFCNGVPVSVRNKISDAVDFCTDVTEITDIVVIWISKWSVDFNLEVSHLRHSHTDIAILVLMESELESDILDALKAGVDECLPQAVSADMLNLKIKRLAASLNTYKELSQNKAKSNAVLERIRQEESFARHVYQKITGGALEQAKDYFSVQHSADGFCGDFIFEMSSPTGIRYVFLADAMGHGLAAALSIMPVIHVVKAMAHRSMPITTIVHEVNRRLNVELPDDRFVTLAGLEISPFSQMISLVNAGLPDICVLLKNGSLESCSSHCMPLGIAEGSAFSFEPYTFKIADVSRLFMFTDGLIEQENHTNETIGKEGLTQILMDYALLNKPWDDISILFDEHKGDMPLSDDVTLCAIDFSKFNIADPDSGNEQDSRNGTVTFNLEVKGDYLKTVDVPAFVSKFLYATDTNGKIAGKTFTAIAELYQNGLDHGVLNLNSDLKNDFSGFEEYLNKRDKALEALTNEDSVTLSLSCGSEEGIRASITDSGLGYDYSKVDPDKHSLSGRGIALVRQLSEHLEINDKGNQVSILLRDN
ncbi:serine/threonine-protein phosphatase [Alteromonas sp. 5E99-2]|uniref:ATP-binding SpoIIE family protein phosphatase n=1 Tax=Alteromonas sp. 5E99-2 TaxID=2817683 RepID=UPI001A97F6A4|nr:ATP-binding SpoIIE family protein phosphatase [Alteromonas sp. 5E99-2]MBO1256173.1 serine/threonine-protein phosphatase [Alteromonas sp. 5E99-2]